MKKTLAILMSAALLLGALSCGIVLTSASAYTTDLYFDFTSKAAIDDIADGNGGGINNDRTGFQNESRVTYTPNEADGAMRVSLPDRNAYWKVYNLTKTVKLTDDAVVAMKVKLPGTESSAARIFRQVRYATKLSDGTSLKDIVSRPANVSALSATTDWQLVVVSLAESALINSNGSDWVDDSTESVYRVLYGIQVQHSDAITYDVAWAGVFESAADAQAHFAATSTSDRTTSYYLDFSTEGRFNDVLNGRAGPTTANTGVAVNVTKGGSNQVNPEGSRTYDTNNLAMKLDIPASDSGNNNWQMYDADSTVDISETSYMALKVRIPDASNVPAIARARVWGTGGVFSADAEGLTTDLKNARKNPLITTGYPRFQATTDWQLLVFELSAATVNNYALLTGWNEDNDESSTWYGFQIEHAAAVSYDVQWAGIFESIADARAHFYATPLDSELKTLGAQLRERDNALRFGFTMTADGVGYAEDNCSAAPLTADSTMIIDGVERQITGFGAVLSTVSADNLTAEAAAADGRKTKLVEATKLYDVNGDKITYYITVVNISEANYEKPIFARAYVEYLDDNGDTAYVYDEAIQRSVDGLLNPVG